MRKRKIIVVILSIVSIALLALAYYYVGGHKTPAAQEPLSDINSQTLDAFKAKFNEARDRTRVILLLSPT